MVSEVKLEITKCLSISGSGVIESIDSALGKIIFSYSKNIPSDVFLRKIDQNFILGAEQDLNIYKLNSQSGSDIIYFNDGTYAAVWISYGQYNISNGLRYSIYGKVCNPGTCSSEFLIESGTGAPPTIAKINEDRFAVYAAEDCRTGVCGIMGIYIYSKDQIFLSKITIPPSTEESSASGNLGYGVGYTRTFSISDNNFGIVWSYNNPITHSGYIYFSSYDEIGNNLVTKVQINDNSGEYKYRPDASALSNGNIVIMWEYLDKIAVQIIDVRGNKRGNEFYLESTETGVHKTPFVLGLTEGMFLGLWKKQDGDGYKIQLAAYSNNGILLKSASNLISSSQLSQDINSPQFGGKRIVQLDNGEVAMLYSNSSSLNLCLLNKPELSSNNATVSSTPSLQEGHGKSFIETASGIGTVVGSIGGFVSFVVSIVFAIRCCYSKYKYGHSHHAHETAKAVIDALERSKNVGVPIGMTLEEGKEISLISLEESKIYFDYDDDGIDEKTSWVSGNDAILVYDYNGNKIVDSAKEIVLSHWCPRL